MQRDPDSLTHPRPIQQVLPVPSRTEPLLNDVCGHVVGVTIDSSVVRTCGYLVAVPCDVLAEPDALPSPGCRWGVSEPVEPGSHIIPLGCLVAEVPSGPHVAAVSGCDTGELFVEAEQSSLVLEPHSLGVIVYVVGDCRR